MRAIALSRSCPIAEPQTSVDPALEHHLAGLLTIAEERAGQPEALLELLRGIEHMHRTIQDGPFRASLPGDRNGLFELLAEMESSGGWPYIPRLQLRTFMDLLQPEAPSEPAAPPQAPPSS